MGNPSRQKYEVRLSDGSRWFVEKQFDDLKIAEKNFQNFQEDDKNQYAGVQLVRVWMRADGNEVEKVLKEEQLVIKVAPVSIVHIEESNMCETQADYLTLASRLTISRILRQLLDRDGMIASNLLYSYEQAKRFMQSDLSLKAIDRISTIQAREFKLDSRKRREELFIAFQAIQDEMMALQKKSIYKKFEEKHLVDVNSYAERLESPLAKMALIIKLLADIRSGEGKLIKITQWLEQEEYAFLEPEFDGLCAEILSSTALVQDLLGPQRNLGEAINTLLDWVEGLACVTNGSCAAQVKTLCHLFTEGRMKQTCDVLFDFILRQIKGKQPLSRNISEQEEPTLIALIDKLIVEDGLIGGSEMAQALTCRYGRMLNQGGESGERMSIKWLVESLEKGYLILPYLLALNDAPLGKSHPDIIKQSLSQLIKNTQSIHDYCLESEPARDKLYALKKLHIMVENSTLDDTDQKMLLNGLDRLVEKYLKDTHLIDKLDNPNDKLNARAMRMVQFCGSGVLWEKGYAMEMAQQRVIDHLRGTSFVEKFTEEENDPSVKEKMIRDFYKLMAKAGFKS